MNERDSRTTSRRPLNYGSDARDPAPDVAVEVLAGVVEQAVHRLAVVVACDVGVEVLPNTLDAVRVGAVRRQEVEQDASAQRVESAEGRACRVDGVVVEDDVDAPHVWSVALVQQFKEIAEQCGVLSRRARRVEYAGEDIERAGQIEFLVLAGGGNAALLAGEHPVAPDLRVE